jgi:hypothetical protein
MHTETWWVIKSPAGDFTPLHGLTRNGVIMASRKLNGMNKWKLIYRDGFRAVRVRVTEIGK